MTKQEKIIQYLADNGIKIEKYIDHFNYQRSGTIVLNSGYMFGYGGNAVAWAQLLELLEKPGCPVKMHRIINRRPNPWGSFRYLINRDRLTWEEQG